MRIATTVALLALLASTVAGQVAAPLEPFRAIEAGDLNDADVENLDGDDLGEIERVVRGPTGEIFAVLEFGGVLGVGEGTRLVPIARFAWHDDELVLPGETRSQLPLLSPWRDGMVGFVDVDDDLPIRIARYRG